ncbi:hypothetical protein LNQ03_07825 [Klebsiella pneumoniae subsp. pneumoniae]|nr:hypothetical protein [Klebsiella pneumoniae subsp. pneumoniae]
MTLDRINEYFAFATSALVTGVGVATVKAKNWRWLAFFWGLFPPSSWRFTAAALSRPSQRR